MPVPKKAFQTIWCSIYLTVVNKYTDRLFWRVVEARSEGIRNLACIIRHYQIGFQNYLESRIDNDVLDDLRNKLNPLISYFRRKSNVISHTSTHFEYAGIHALLDSFPYSTSLYKPVKTQLKKYPTISIVTPNYNQGKFLEKCIQSVLTQDYPSFEHIIIDGGSTDNSIEIIKKYENKLTYWVSEKDDGQADAINKGLRYATGEIFNWLNSDDYFEPGALLKCAEAYEKEPSAVGWVGGCRRIDSNGRVLTVIYPNGMDRENIGQNWNGRQFYQPSCFLSTKRVKEVGGLNPDLYIALDLDLWIRILENGTFFAGKGIWSNAIIHTDAKTQERERVLLETVDVQRKHGFLDGANIRYKYAFKKGKFQYVPPMLLKDRLKSIENSSKIGTGLPYDKRRHICFIADFNVNHNIDAVRYFIDNIFAFILRRNPHVEFHIVGSDSARSWKEFKLPNVKIIGNIRNLERPLENYRLCVFPIAYQAGVNDGIGIAAGAGLPIVTTSINAEDYPVKDGEECFIADLPLEFAEKCNQCMSDSIAWHNLRVKSQLMIAENYSPAGIARKPAKIFQDR